MEASAGLVTGSHERNELVLIRGHGENPPPVAARSGRVCEICGEQVGPAAAEEEGDLFVACNECAFPVCRPCYEYERREGNQVCPHCKTRYRRLKGSPRVEGDEDEDDVDDVDQEFNRPPPPATIVSGRGAADYGGGADLPSIITGARSVPVSGELPRRPGMVSRPTFLLEEASSPLPVIPTREDEEGRQALSRKVPMASSKVNPYRMAIVLRLVALGFFLRHRMLNPAPDATGLWLTSVVCEVWFAVSWILDQFPKWFPVDRETYLDRLSLRYEREGEPSRLAAVDVFVSTVDPLKEPPLVTANTVLSVLAVDYPADRISCFVSDDGAAMLTFESLAETAEFARRWVPFCKRFAVEPRAPEMYFSQKVDFLKDKVHPAFVKERRAMKREYEEFKVRVNALVAKALRAPPEGRTMKDGTPWPGNNAGDHPGMIQVFLGNGGEGELPRLVYASREKRPGFDHHKKAGAMNALIRVSGVLTNAPFVLNLDCDHYVNNSKAIREAMCFFMDPPAGRKVCFVQFPQRFDGIDRHDRYANRNTVFFDINMKGLDGIQGPAYVGTGCVFRRRALYGHPPPERPRRPRMVTCDCLPGFGRRKKKPDGGVAGGGGEMNIERRFGLSPAFLTSTLMDEGGVPPCSVPAALLREAIHVLSCAYEDKTEWGLEVGWIYGSITEDILTGFKMHCRGWRSVYCNPRRAAFKGSAPVNLSDRLVQVLRWALGSVEILFGRHNPLWYGRRLKVLQRVAYVNTAVYPFTSLPLLAYCALPAVCLLSGKFIMPPIGAVESLVFIGLFASIVATGVLELRWSGVSVEEWWRNEQFWVIGGVSAHLAAVAQGLLKVVAGVETRFTVTSKAAGTEDGGGGGGEGELYAFKWTALLIPPASLLVVNLIGVVAGVAEALASGYQSWGPLFGKLFFAFWVVVHLYPFLKGLMGREKKIPTIVVIWSVLLASIFSLLWVRIDPFVIRATGPDVRQCGINC